MFEAQVAKTPGRPWHLWLIAVFGGLWNAFGAVSFVLAQLRVEAVMSEYPPEQRAYFESFPFWAVAFWAIGVFGGVIGCVLLLLKNRFAVPVLAASVVGAIASNLGGLFLLGGMEVMAKTGAAGFALGFAVFIIVFASFQAYYARAMRKNGVLG